MRHRVSLIASAALLTAAACAPREATESDPRLSQVTVGIKRDSLLKILGSGSASGDSLANIYRREIYLLNGVPLEILFYSPEGLKEGQGTAAAESTLRPVVLNYDAVAGWGWAYYDSVARVNDIRVRVR